MSLQEKISHLPKSPGVYFMKDNKGTIIYVGKAKSLKPRVSSYFQNTNHSMKTRALVSEIADFDLLITKTEVEALLLERSMIRHHQPRFNILLRDDKEYPYVRIDFNDPWPRIKKVRRRKNDQAKYIGPFGHAGLLNDMLKTVLRVFPLIRCSPHEFANTTRVCNYYHMKMCLGPCVYDVDRDEYISMLNQATQLLEGKSSEVRTQLTAAMHDAAKRERFEQAARLRDQIRTLEGIAQQQSVVVHDYEEADIVGYFEQDETITFNVTIVRDYSVLSSLSYQVGSSIDSIEETLTSFLLQYYHQHPTPKIIITPLKLNHDAHLLTVLSEGEKYTVCIKTGFQGEGKDLVSLATRNARFFSEQSTSLQLKQKAELEILKQLLELDKTPQNMECIDISNLQGNSIVASCVSFINGKPAKQNYRRYNITSVVGKNDDFASIYEVVTRRLKRGIEEHDLPDLLVIDGGKGQLQSALQALTNFPDLNLDIVSLAKSRALRQKSDISSLTTKSSERVFLPNKTVPIELSEGSPSYRIMTRIRDEAHRFAISFHRKKRTKTSLESTLQEIPGIGPKTNQKLLQTFGSIDNMRKASLEQIKKVPGIKEPTAVKLHAWLQEKSD